MKIYTKTGDKGYTALIGGTRVPKYDIRVEAYGSVDELISHIGLIRSQEIDAETIDVLHKIQIKLMNVAAILASDGTSNKLPKILSSDVEFLEKEIDKIDEYVEPLNCFILPGGHNIPAFCNIARCVCRRAERIILHLNAENPISETLLAFINRLSDYLFALSRKFHKDLNVEELMWVPET